MDADRLRSNRDRAGIQGCRTLEWLDTHKFEAISTPNFRVLAYSVAAGSILLTAGLWILNNGTITD